MGKKVSCLENMLKGWKIKMYNIYNFIMTFFFTYSFVFIFKKLGNNAKHNISLELKYIIMVSIIDFILDDLATKSFKLWIYYILLQIVIYFLYKEIYKEQKFEFFLYYILTFWIFQISDILTGMLMNISVTLNYLLNKNTFLSITMSQFIVILIAILLTTIISNIKNIDRKICIQENKLFWIYTNIMVMVYMMLIYYYNNTTNTQNIIIISIIVLCFFLFISYFMFITLNKLYIEKNTRNYIEMYNGVIEESLENMNIYKHDQKNILLSIGGFLNNNDIEGLKKYFYEDIVKNQYIDNKILVGLVNIQNSPVKGLIYAKITKATSNHINLYINIKDTVESFFIKDIDMCKMLGILIDNAIESSVESKEKLLNIGIWKEESEVYIVVSNSFKNEPVIHKIFEKGYSTKSLNRGLGLNIVRDLIESKYRNMNINTKIENNLFNIEIIIKKID